MNEEMLFMQVSSFMIKRQKNIHINNGSGHYQPSLQDNFWIQETMKAFQAKVGQNLGLPMSRY